MSYLNLDFKTPNHKKRSRQPRLSKKLIKTSFYIAFGITILIFIALFALQPSEPDSSEIIIETLELPLNIQSDAIKKPAQSINSEPETQIDFNIIKETIKSGDSLSTIFDRHGIHASVLFKLIDDSEHGDLLKTINIGQQFHFYMLPNNQLSKLLYMPDVTNTYEFSTNQDEQFESKLITNPLEAIPTFRKGIIDSSLFVAAAKSNIPENIIMNLVGIFGWDIDFALDIRKGDHFKVIYNELYQDGNMIKTGQILAAEFVNQNRSYQAILYTDPTGLSNYFSPNGKSMRKAFLRSPVKFSRISSRFTSRRWHPVLSKWRSHKGVDYAASRGTPVYAAGDGKIILAGTKGGYGRTVIIQHGGKYTTLYAHLNSYNRNARRGRRVKQGQTIGYVGSSGLATGPHLHYEFRVSGVHRNPLTVKLPAAQPINKKYKAEFDIQKDKLLHMLKIMDNEQ